MQAQTHNDGAAEAITNTYSVGRKTERPYTTTGQAHKKQLDSIYKGTKR
ncbi:hypothetical protein [Pseudomonas sp. BC115LW]|nr:hypothetical protein [Pseudomonas sp. BC115LW]